MLLRQLLLVGIVQPGAMETWQGPRIFIHPKRPFTTMELNRTCQCHPPPMAFLWHSWHIHNTLSSAPLWLNPGSFYSRTVCQLLFSHRHKLKEIFSRQRHFIWELRKHSLGDTHFTGDGRKNKDRLEERISLMEACALTLARARVPSHTRFLLHAHRSDKRSLITQQMDAPLITG